MLHASMLNSLDPNHSLCSTDLHQVNPVDTTIAAIIAVGLRDKQITISFAKMIHRKKKFQETGTTFPLSAEYLSAVMKTHLQRIFLKYQRKFSNTD